MAGTTSLAILPAVLDLVKAPHHSQLTSKPILTWHVLTRFFDGIGVNQIWGFHWKRLNNPKICEAWGGSILCPPQNSMATCIKTSEDTFSTKSIIFFEFCFFNYPILYVCFLCFTMFYYVLLYFWGLFLPILKGTRSCKGWYIFQLWININAHRHCQFQGRYTFFNVLNRSWFTVWIVFPSFRPAIWPHTAIQKQIAWSGFSVNFPKGGSKDVFSLLQDGSLKLPTLNSSSFKVFY